MTKYDALTDELIVEGFRYKFVLKKRDGHHIVEQIVEDHRGCKYYILRDQLGNFWAADCIDDQNADYILNGDYTIHKESV